MVTEFYLVFKPLSFYKPRDYFSLHSMSWIVQILSPPLYSFHSYVPPYVTIISRTCICMIIETRHNSPLASKRFENLVNFGDPNIFTVQWYVTIYIMHLQYLWFTSNQLKSRVYINGTINCMHKNSQVHDYMNLI